MFRRNLPLISIIVCIIVTASFVGLVANYALNNSSNDEALAAQQATINSLKKQISNLTAQLKQNNDTIASLNQQLDEAKNRTVENPPNKQTPQPNSDNTAALNAQIANLQSQITAQQKTISDLTEAANQARNARPTYVFHVCEKGAGYTWGRLPNATDTYNQILALDNYRHNVVLLPEYQGHQSWSDELAWIAANFGGRNGIPVMIDVFGGGDAAVPNPMLTTSQIQQAMAVANVKAIRFAEVFSWYQEHNQTVPTDYVANILAFCRTNNLPLFWTEWKTDGFSLLQNYIRGYEDLVTVSFSTNSCDLPPTDGFLYLRETFPQWGASIQAWYWTTHEGYDLMTMPPSLMLEHMLSATGVGAKTIQFEPYWFLFDNGQANNNLRILLSTDS